MIPFLPMSPEHKYNNGNIAEKSSNDVEDATVAHPKVRVCVGKQQTSKGTLISMWLIGDFKLTDIKTT